MTHHHLSDEQLSAHLDNQPSDAATLASSADSTAQQISDCDVCRRRLAALTEARHLVAQAVDPVAPSMRAAAVEAALSEGRGPESSADSPAPSAVLRPRRRGWPKVSVDIAAAAVLLVVGGSIGLLIGRTHHSTPAPAAAPVTHVAISPPPTSKRAGLAPSGVTRLGAVSSPSALRTRLAPVVALGRPTENSSAAPTADGLQTQSGAASMPAFSGVGGTSTGTSCVPAPAQLGPAPATDLVASLTYQGTPALVVVFTAGANGAPTTTSPDSSTTPGSPFVAVVVARSGCRVLARVTL